ncbi:hypothetical protein GALMADRAFT_148340 [Galerina marginata CBS 339.88]|uniref:F-box domain-containing protein n=1 Tax=Galerina marginata (strain CBS 339.88) TaxID=685588 RepID=A0A067S4S2_GALM3|nr:hypothetical protein GALMADRAFT_148340 [Galerina marginata CBS 339.88]
MSAGQTAHSPISTLHFDLLWVIFMMNTELEGQYNGFETRYGPETIHPLITARWTSQVCSKWRSIAVESQTLWSSILELGLLAQRANNWRNEVIRRTGRAGLSLTGWVDWNNSISVSFFNFLVLEHWDRIQKLDVEFRNCETLPDYLESALSRPAPNLSHICLWFWSTDKATCGLSSQIFPSVQHGFLFHWTPQLRAVTMSCITSTTDLFSALLHMPMLESLEIKSRLLPRSEPGLSRWKEVALPRLSLLVLQGSFDICLDILERVVPSRHCVLHLRVIDTRPENMTTDEDRIAKYQKILQQYSTSYFSSRRISALHISLTDYYISINAHPKYLRHAFSLEVRLKTIYKMPSGVYSTFLYPLSPLQLSSLTTLRLRFWSQTSHLFLRREFMDLASSCTNIKILQIDGCAAGLLCSIITEQPTLFPLLHTLRIEPADLPILTTVEFAAYVLSFLELRQKADKPLKLLDLVHLTNQDTIEYWDAFMEVNVRNQNIRCLAGKADDTGYDIICFSCAIAQIGKNRGDFCAAVDAFMNTSAKLESTESPASSPVRKSREPFLEKLHSSWKKFTSRSKSIQSRL